MYTAPSLRTLALTGRMTCDVLLHLNAGAVPTVDIFDKPENTIVIITAALHDLLTTIPQDCREADPRDEYGALGDVANFLNRLRLHPTSHGIERYLIIGEMIAATTTCLALDRLTIDAATRQSMDTSILTRRNVRVGRIVWEVENQTETVEYHLQKLDPR